MRKEHQKGFTLIEVMIAVAIIGILAAIAFPSYQDYVRKARRADAKEALLRVQLEQEKWRANNATYSSALTMPTLDYYTIMSAAGPGPTATDYTVTATATGSQVHDSQGGTSCATLIITVAGGAETRTHEDCW